MKKSIYLLAALALFGCNMVEYAFEEPENFSIQATMESEDTKTSVSDAGYFTWSAGDKIWLHTTNGGVEGVLSAGAGTSNATFSYGAYYGEMTGKSVYPYGDHSIKENTLIVNLPESYDLGATTDNTNAAMYAVVVDGTLKFTHLAGVMRFEFKNAPVGTNQFKITVDKRINGPFNVDLTDAHPTLNASEATSDAERTVVINFDALEEVKDLRIYVPLPIGTYESLALELNAGEQNIWKYSKAVSNTVNRKTLLLMPTISMGGTIGGDIENDGSIDGDIDNGDNGDLYIKFEDGSAYKDLGVMTVSGGYISYIPLHTNVETGFEIEYLVNGTNWMSAYVTSNRLRVQIYRNKGFARSATIKVSAKDNKNAYVEVRIAQESSIEETMTYTGYYYEGDTKGNITNISSNSLDFNVGAELEENQSHVLLFDTNVTDYIWSIPENDMSWLYAGNDRANDAIVIRLSSNESQKRSSAIEVTCPHTGKVFYTINVIQQAKPAECVDLSANGTANSYIVSEAGSYKFAPTKGNSNESVGEIASAEVLWESFGTDVTPNVGELVTSAKYEDGVISFETPSEYKEGNAVIAAKDASGTILWSWHIWLTDQPEGQEYFNDAGTMMDRNLGATSATPGDVGALGLLYQWGRKDPFLGSSSISESVEARSTISWPSAVSSDSNNGTIEYATANPTTFIWSYDTSHHLNWYYTVQSSDGENLWTPSSSVKSIYDPCPAGWRVPDGGSRGAWLKATGWLSFKQIYDSTNKGFNFSGTFGYAPTIWYPAAGASACAIFRVSDIGAYWTASTSGTRSLGMYCYNSGTENIYASEPLERFAGYSVRCIQESK